jgi:VWFA-related protein
LTLVKTGTYTEPMNARRITPAVFALAAAALAPHLRSTPVAFAPGAQAIQRSLTVSVVDTEGIPVLDLGPSDFIVREDNVAREVLRVVPFEEPMQIAVLVDTSTAARNNISYYRTALPQFVGMLTNATESGPKNRVALIATGERPTIVTDYTASLAELQRGINRLWSLPGTGAYFLDAILETAQGFKKREATRPVIVAITQEGSELSYRHHEQVLDALRDGNIAFYPVMIGTPSGSMTDEARSRNIVLDQGPRDTGGYLEQLLTPMALGGSLKQLADRLLHQYLVTYAHPETLIPPEHVTVAAKKPGLTARGTLVRDKFTR